MSCVLLTNNVTLKTEIVNINCLITNLSKRLDSIESSQQMISDKYDSILESIQSVDQDTDKLSKQLVRGPR